MNYTTSKKLIENTKGFLDIHYYSLFDRIFFRTGTFYGWGRKKSGLNAVSLAKKHHTAYVLLEDGFIRSYSLGVEGSLSFSIVQDDLGIYYDATMPSRLEHILNNYDFSSNRKLMKDTKKALHLIVQHHISKYNNAPDIKQDYFSDNKNRVLIVAQTSGDASLTYGMLDPYTTDDMIHAAKKENPDAIIYLKIHPDVLSGKKKSDINIGQAKEKCIIIDENVNPISLLKHFDKVYTKTSQMGFEALLAGCECICFGMPFYAGWGLTTDKSVCKRRKRKLQIEEVFAAAYILYTKYYDPYEKRESNIFDTINTMIALRQKSEV